MGFSSGIVSQNRKRFTQFTIAERAASDNSILRYRHPSRVEPPMRTFLPAIVLGLVCSAVGRPGELAGYKLLVNSVRNGTAEVFIVDPETGDAVNVTRAVDAETRYPMWSPDGKQFAVTCKREGTFNLFVLDADGRNLRQLTHEKAPAVAYMPSWRGDGNLIVFGLTRDKPLIASIAPDGSHLQIIGEGLDPCISPDGKAIAFVKKVGKGWCIFAMDPDGKNIRQLTTHESEVGAVHPFWTPDSTHLLYSHPVGDKQEIFRCDADGKNVKQLTHLNKISTSAAMSPDGKWIAFRVTPSAFWRNPPESARVYRDKPADLRPIYVMKADGSDPHVIECLHYQCAMDGSRPAWKPK
jgi:TolB protein